MSTTIEVTVLADPAGDGGGSTVFGTCMTLLILGLLGWGIYRLATRRARSDRALWQDVQHEYDRVLLDYNLQAQMHGAEAYFVEPAEHARTANDPMFQLALRNVMNMDADRAAYNKAVRRARDDGYGAGFTAGWWTSGAGR